MSASDCYPVSYVQNRSLVWRPPSDYFTNGYSEDIRETKGVVSIAESMISQWLQSNFFAYLKSSIRCPDGCLDSPLNRLYTPNQLSSGGRSS